MLRDSITWAGVAEKEGLQVLREYEFHLVGAAVASSRLRDWEEYAKYCAKVEALRPVFMHLWAGMGISISSVCFNSHF